jgi:hypothetical protein
MRALVSHVIPGARVYFPRRIDRRVRYSWNGRHLRPTGLTLESHCHEVAHLLVSSRRRRALPEFGLGPDPYRHSDAARAAPLRDADREELDACTMQRVLVRLFGLDESAVVSEVRAEPLSVAGLRALRRRHPDALPGAWWKRALRCAEAPLPRVGADGAGADVSAVPGIAHAG